MKHHVQHEDVKSAQWGSRGQNALCGGKVLQEVGRWVELAEMFVILHQSSGTATSPSLASVRNRSPFTRCAHMF
ncbi:hypothetical protein OUZ56_006271 [Daphnia magna]|uniref:Uncharacterized protein n=1 Tax=Daphnia magna TaxID=35525 RepID=A0ABQ9YV55_9CRUS|nr:hypothetical protein OUZ56_006271 [Daphnia magna]